MIKHYLNHFKNLVFIVSVAALIFSCTSQKKLVYLQNKAKGLAVADTTQLPKNVNYRIKALDNLFIKVISIDPKSMEYSGVQTMAGNTDTYFTLNGYTVNDSGYIQLPIAGNVKVTGLTIPEAKEKIQKSVDQYIVNSSISVKLLNFRISVLGDVIKAGTFYVYDNSINIFQALALAGDIGPFGNSRKIKLIRLTDKGPEISILNLTDRNILHSDKFYLAPNDIIYVEPNATSKTLGFIKVPWEIIISGISTTILLISYLKK